MPAGLSPNITASLQREADKSVDLLAVMLGDSAYRNVGTTPGTVAAGDDSRFNDSRTPAGVAGGDLTGTYPDPTLAVDRAHADRQIIDGYGITGGGDLTADRTLTVALSQDSGALGSDQALTNSYADVMVTASLAVGTWLIFAGTHVSNAAATEVSFRVTTGTATATIAGKSVGQTTDDGEIHLVVSVAVTAPGTLVFQGEYTGTSGTLDAGGKTGYVAVRIA